MSETISEYVKKKAFENIIVSKLLEKMEELYEIRNSIEDCLKEVNIAIRDIEVDFLKVMDKVGD